MKKILITGGAGFVGSSLAVLFRHHIVGAQITAIDSLKRRGSELNLARLKQADVRFVHGDIRCEEDLNELPDFELLVDCSAEPSVQAGTKGSPRAVLNTNLVGTINCLELAHRRGAAFMFLSTSRVYPMKRLNELPFEETESRFVWTQDDKMSGYSTGGVSEQFSLEGPRSFYGASKLASELLIQEYVFNKGLRALINRCGILTGPWQMGKVDQGVITLWMARHIFQRPLNYVGFGGSGKQVRDVLHVEDLFDLLMRQMADIEQWNGNVFNVGGGVEVSVSLAELTDLCQQISGSRVPISSVTETNPVDVRIYVTDYTRASGAFSWRPTRTAVNILEDIQRWIMENRNLLSGILE